MPVADDVLMRELRGFAEQFMARLTFERAAAMLEPAKTFTIITTHLRRKPTTNWRHHRCSEVATRMVSLFP